jgi:hypothetical protein
LRIPAKTYATAALLRGLCRRGGIILRALTLSLRHDGKLTSTALYASERDDSFNEAYVPHAIGVKVVRVASPRSSVAEKADSVSILGVRD